MSREEIEGRVRNEIQREINHETWRGLRVESYRFKVPIPPELRGSEWDWGYCSHWSTHPGAEPLVSLFDAAQALTALLAENERLREALTLIRDWEPKPFAFPEDWSEQIKACPKCQAYAGHPVQMGVCDEHRRPLWDREKHDAHGERLRGWEAKSIARAALNKDPDQ